MSPARIVWRPRSVNIGGGLWWDCCLFVFRFTHTTEGQCERLHGRDWEVSFLTLSSPGVEAPGSPPALCYTEFSHRVQERLLLFPSLWDLNTSKYKGSQGTSFFYVTLLNQHLLTQKIIQFLLTNGYILSVSCCVRDPFGTQQVVTALS